nr:MAG TPA: major capsid protein [Caudoviricetes sp.]
MEVSQIYQFVNNATQEAIGQSDLLAEDLSNIVDVGTAIFNASAFDKYVKSLVNRIGRTIFVNRPYRGSVPSVLMDSWEFGSVCMKIASEMPTAQENESWELEDGTSYDPNIFHAPKAEAKFFNKMVTFEIDRSITEMQVKQSFSSQTELNAFISMLYNEVDKSMTVKMNSLIMRTINNMIAETVYDAFKGTAITGAGNTRAINLLSLYNTKFTKTLKAEAAITDPDFLRYASFELARWSDRLAEMSTLFNVGGKSRFTPKDLLHVVMLSDFAAGASTYLYSDTYHDQYVRIAEAERVPYWQGSGTTYGFDKISSIDVTTASNNAQKVSGILCVMFDREALGVTNMNSRVTTNYNAKAEFTNYFYKRDARYFNDLNENFIVFYVA